MTDTETVLLMYEGSLLTADVPAGARLHTVPEHNGIPYGIRGLTFERTSKDDDILHLPLFRQKSRQL